MMMLDSDICVFLIRKNRAVLDKFLNHADQIIGISSVVFYKLERGIQLNRIAKERQQATRDFLSAVHVLDFSAKAAAIAAELEAKRTMSGERFGVEDAFIAAHAIALNAVLVTANSRHFEGTPGLQLANWTK